MSEQPIDEQPIEPDVHFDDPVEPEEQPDTPQDDDAEVPA